MPPKPAVRGEYIETETGNKISRRATILGPKHIVLAGKCVIQHDVVIHGDLVRPSSASTTRQSASAGTTASGKDSKPASAMATATPEPTSIHLGRYVFVSTGSTLHPPSRLSSSTSTSTSSAASGGGGGNGDAATTTATTTTSTLTYYPLRISDYVYIGPNSQIRAAEIRSNVHIGANCVVGNMCIIKDNVKILDGSVLPANSVWVSNTVVGGRPAEVIGELGEGWGSGGASGTSGVEEGIGVRSRERWAAVGNKR